MLVLIFLLKLLTLGSGYSALSRIWKRDVESHETEGEGNRPIVFLTVSSLASQSKNQEDRMLELNWNRTPPDTVERDAWIRLYDTDPLHNATRPLESVRPDAVGYFRTSFRFPEQNFSRRHLSDACLGFWIAYAEGEEILSTNCIRARPNWMRRARPVIGNFSLMDLMIPGTHNTGTYAAFDSADDTLFNRYLITQEVDVWHQLVYGIRYLDLRVAYRNSSPGETTSLWITHSSFVTKIPVREVVRQVKDFLDSTDEIVIMDFHRGHCWASDLGTIINGSDRPGLWWVDGAAVLFGSLVWMADDSGFLYREADLMHTLSSRGTARIVINLRVVYRDSSTGETFLRITHSSFFTKILVSELVTQARDFLDINHEIAIMDFHRFVTGFKGRRAARRHQELVSMLESELGSYMIPVSFTSWASLNTLWATGKRLYVGYADENSRRQNPLLFPAIRHLWGDVDSVDGLKNYLNRTVCSHRNRRLTSAMAQLTPTTAGAIFNLYGGLRNMADNVNREVTRWFRDEWNQCANIVATDFFLGNNIIEVSIETNKKKSFQ